VLYIVAETWDCLCSTRAQNATWGPAKPIANRKRDNPDPKKKGMYGQFAI